MISVTPEDGTRTTGFGVLTDATDTPIIPDGRTGDMKFDAHVVVLDEYRLPPTWSL
jgi:hypothetical protein